MRTKLFWSLYTVATLLLMVGVFLGILENGESGGSIGAGTFFAGLVLAGALWIGFWISTRND